MLAVRSSSGRGYVRARVHARACTIVGYVCVPWTRKGTKEAPSTVKSREKEATEPRAPRPPTTRIIPSRVFSTLATLLRTALETDPFSSS